MLDLVAGLLSAGSTTYQIPAEAERETRLSQVFIAFDPSRCGDSIDTSDLAEQVIRHTTSLHLRSKMWKDSRLT